MQALISETSVRSANEELKDIAVSRPHGWSQHGDVGWVERQILVAHGLGCCVGKVYASGHIERADTLNYGY